MEFKNNISTDEINLEKAVANLPKGNPYSVPTGYFDQFPEQILNILSSDPVVNFETGKNNPFTLPALYFEEFPSEIIKNIKQKENPEAELAFLSASMLSELKKENPFTVPEGYFNNFKTKIPAKDSNLYPLIGIKRTLQYAAAACIVGIMFFAYNGMTNKKNQEIFQMATATQPAELSLESIASYLNESEFTASSPVTEEVPTKETNLLVDINKETVSMVLSEVSENDIRQYLNQSGETFVNSLN